MRLYRDGQTVDVQPKHVARYEADGWTRTPDLPADPGEDFKPDNTSGDVSTEEGDS